MNAEYEKLIKIMQQCSTAMKQLNIGFIEALTNIGYLIDITVRFEKKKKHLPRWVLLPRIAKIRHCRYSTIRHFKYPCGVPP